MNQRLVSGLFVFFFSIATCHAANWTGISSRQPVQCNGWGWSDQFAYTVWSNGCTPLEVKVDDETTYSIPTTEGQCDDDKVAIYQYVQGATEIDFKGCFRR